MKRGEQFIESEMNILDIPVETRSRIIRLLLTRPCPVDVNFENTRVGLQDACCVSRDTGDACCGYLECRQGLRPPGRLVMSAIKHWICVGPLFSIQLFRVCNQIYHEAVEILYADNKFILTSVTLEEIPLSQANLFRIRSLQLSALDLQPGQNLVNYQRMIKHLKLNPDVRLPVTSNSDNQAFLHSFATSLSFMAPVRSCSLWLGSYTKAQSLCVKLIGQEENRLFSRYNDLPLEIRYQILSHTDLVQNYQITDGKLYFSTQCCRHYCETLFPCCCNTIRRHRERIFAGSRFSDRCTCKFNPQSLLKVSSGFRIEALRVMFARPGQFYFSGQIRHGLSFLRKIEPHLP